ncbi:sulfotransferase [Sphingomonas oryzagri]
MGPNQPPGLESLACLAARVRLLSDVHERGCDLGIPLPLGAKRSARIERIERTGLVFVHIPKAAGMSVSETLYGLWVKHASIRWLRHVQGGRLAGLPSFAILRQPADRFVSAYRFARTGGSACADNYVSEPFSSLYRAFRSIDDALDHVEAAASPYAVDHIFRPQRWYITDRAGRIAVDRLVRINDIARLPMLVPGFPDRTVPFINRGEGEPIALTGQQMRRLQSLYAADFALWERLCVGTVSEPSAQPAAAVSEPALATA